MVLITEEKLLSWIKPASDSEETRCNSTINNIKNCIQNYDFERLGQPEIRLRGSYNNNTNVKNDSDVDMYALFKGFYYDVNENFHIIPGVYGTGIPYENFKTAITLCLRRKYGLENVKYGNKSINIKNNSYRVNADVVPVVKANYYGLCNIEGVAFFSSDSQFIINFPDQDCTNGREKNNSTSNRYKFFVRIFKRLRNELEDEGILKFKIPSYVIESLLYNIPDQYFMTKTYTTGVINIVNYLLGKLDTFRFVEVNHIKEMFRPDLFPEQTTTRLEVKVYLSLIWQSISEAQAA